MNKYLTIAPEVQDALNAKLPVVALESTIISHGMPYPNNVETALAVEAEVRNGGAIPATICLMDGKLKVGLSATEIDVLGRADGVHKVSRQDIAKVLVRSELGATTVAGTMIVAEMAGIRVFATGGIGGVHRNVSDTWDISADLEELAKTSVAVVCAGVKTILDVSKTLEVLETKGVPVATFGSRSFPGFYSRNIGLESPRMVEDLSAFAKELQMKWGLGLAGGVLLANPIPQASAIDHKQMERVITAALDRANEQGLYGKLVTPFLLREVVARTDGRALKANIALIKANAALAAGLAKEVSNII